jgi:hypothetical protein
VGLAIVERGRETRGLNPGSAPFNEAWLRGSPVLGFGSMWRCTSYQ